MTMSNPKISLVIPFYNIQECVDYCIESVRAQQYDNYEIICVDDGSTDCTGELLDKQALKDSRIRVLHKSNGGLSDARNAGVDCASGYYVSFIDGDDIVSPYYLDSLVNGMPESGNAMIIGKAVTLPQRDVHRGGIKWKRPNQLHEASREDVVRGLLTKKIGTVAWAKLAPRNLYIRHRFPVGVRYEELRTIGDFIRGVERYLIIDEPIYGYVMREGSIVWAKKPTYAQAKEYLEAIEQSSQLLGSMCPSMTNELSFYETVMLTRLHDFISRGLDNQEEQKALERTLRQRSRKQLISALCANDASLAQKARVMLYTVSPWPYDHLMRFYNQRVKGL